MLHIQSFDDVSVEINNLKFCDNFHTYQCGPWQVKYTLPCITDFNLKCLLRILLIDLQNLYLLKSIKKLA